MIIKRLVNLWIIAGLLIAVATTAAAAKDKLKFSRRSWDQDPGYQSTLACDQERFLRGSRFRRAAGAAAWHACCRSGAGGRIAVYNNGSADAMVSAAAGGADLVSVAGMVNGLTQAIGANKKYGSIKELRGTIVGVQSLASGATTVLKRIFKKNGLDYRPITSCLLSAAATSILRR